jgi:hypothetical protein
MEYRLALNYMNLSVKRKLSKVLECWRNYLVRFKLKPKPKKSRMKFLKLKKLKKPSNLVLLTEPSPVSSKILKRNRYSLVGSFEYNSFWNVGLDKIKTKPVPIKPSSHLKSFSEFNNFKTLKTKENHLITQNEYKSDEIAVVSSTNYNQINYITY